jgi:hypothetical protein
VIRLILCRPGRLSRSKFHAREVIRHRLGVPEHQHPYFDDVDMVGPGEETILEAALGGAYTIDDLIEVSRRRPTKMAPPTHITALAA